MRRARRPGIGRRASAAPNPPRLAAELARLLDASPDAVLVADRDGRIVVVNRRVEQLFGFEAGQLTGRPVETLLPASARAGHAARRAAYTAEPTVRAMSARAGLVGLRADGTEVPVEISLSPVMGSADGLIMAVVHDVTGRHRLEQALKRSSRAAGALDAIRDAIVTTDADARVDFLNSAAERLTGWPRKAARGRPLGDVLPVSDEAGEASLERMVAVCLRSERPSPPCEAMLQSDEGGEPRALDISATPIRRADGQVSGAALVVRDVTHARLIARQLSHQATHDALTGLVNRSEFERRLGRLIGSAGRGRAEHALCFLDLDGFKLVNDSCGHQAGDELLRQLSDLMTERMRSRDTLARLGGDEFGLLLEHCRLPTAERIAEGIRASIAGHRYAVKGQSYAVGVSIGIVPIGGSEAAGEVLRAADRACYIAKRLGGNRIHVHDPARRTTRSSPAEGGLRQVRAALEHDRFRLYAQAVVPLAGANGGAPRLELLIRLDAGRRAPLLPARFLPTARRHGLMPEVDRWVIRQVVRRLDEWCRAHPDAHAPAVAINLSDESVIRGDVPTLLREAMAGTVVAPGSLCLEISEAVAAAHPTASVRLLQELRAAGCRTTLDHCGSGMAAFTLLRRLPVHYIKIAGHVVRAVTRDPVERALATAINDVGHALGLATVAVEAETPEVLACLRRLGVDFAQGYGIARPEPLEAALDRFLVIGPPEDRSASAS